jgi:hypothetical protein
MEDLHRAVYETVSVPQHTVTIEHPSVILVQKLLVTFGGFSV